MAPAGPRTAPRSGLSSAGSSAPQPGAAGGRVLVGDPAARGADPVQPADGLATLVDRFHAPSLPRAGRGVTVAAPPGGSGWDAGAVPSRLAPPRRPHRRRPRRTGRLGRPPPPGACPPRSGRTAAGCARSSPARRTSPTASSTTRCPTPALAPGQHPRRPAAAVARGAARRPAGRPRSRWPGAELPAEAAELAVTWFGHASALLEVDGRRVLVDPVWGAPRLAVPGVRADPAARAADARSRTCPPVDAVLISHDHYDHLDLPTVRALLATQTAPFVVPLGIGEHLRKWGVPEERIVELDWDEHARRRRADAHLHRGAALLRPLLPPRHHAVGVLGDHRPAAPRLLRRRHRLHPGVRRDRRPARARSTSRCCRSAPTTTPGTPSTWTPRRPSARTATSAARCCCPSTGRRSTWPSTAGPSRSSGCWPPPRARGVTVVVPRPGRADRRAGPAAARATGGRRSARPPTTRPRTGARRRRQRPCSARALTRLHGAAAGLTLSAAAWTAAGRPAACRRSGRSGSTAARCRRS